MQRNVGGWGQGREGGGQMAIGEASLRWTRPPCHDRTTTLLIAFNNCAPGDNIIDNIARTHRQTSTIDKIHRAGQPNPMSTEIGISNWNASLQAQTSNNMFCFFHDRSACTQEDSAIGSLSASMPPQPQMFQNFHLKFDSNARTSPGKLSVHIGHSL